MQTPLPLSSFRSARTPLSDADHARLLDTFTAALEHQLAHRPSPDALVSRLLPLVRLASLHAPEALARHVDSLVLLTGSGAAEPLGELAASLARAGRHAAAARIVRTAGRALTRRLGAGTATMAILTAALRRHGPATPARVSL